jgi:hypothetical protein
MNEPQTRDPELACGVLSRAAPPGLAAAVRSLLDQSEPIEVVVVNSDGGDPDRVLREAGIHGVPVVHFEHRLFPGAARNAAIAATRAPYVAFLADDCVAEPGWAAGRLREHRAGAETVACVMSSATPGNAASNASLLLQHNRRLPDTPPCTRLRFGLSYTRDVLERLGPFPEEIRAGEDSKLNARLATQPVWAADVRCAHAYPTTLGGLVSDLYARGRRRGALRLADGEPVEWAQVKSALRNCRRSWQQAGLTTDPQQRRELLAARPLLPLGAAAVALGVGLQAFRRPVPLPTAWPDFSSSARGTSAAPSPRVPSTTAATSPSPTTGG